MEKTYTPADLQTKWNRRWEETHAFEAKSDAKPTFTIFMPPPNVTGILHMGHVLNNTIQDVLCRWARLQGKSVLWLPGTDHAGIATQSKVEKILKAEKGLTRHQLGRETFLQRVEKWRQEHGQVIFEQLKRLGVSCDWSRATYTLDPDYSRRVQSVFVKLYKRGYIYKGKRLVHWCPVSQTALSDEEVIMKPTQGVLYTFRYAVVEKPGTFLPIASTRPETIMGDVALAVHPKDPRYASLIGLHARCPFDPQRTIPIIADQAVEMDFGTGALKITPAHDPIDFEIGKRHQLPFIEVLDATGRINENGAPFTGMDRMEARKAVIEALREKGLLVKEEPYEHAVGYSERANVPIEPRLSEQWFLRYPKVEEAKQLLEKKQVHFYPAHWEKIYRHWLNHLQDWCISRQLWWGHRIPVWYRKDDPSKYHVSLEAPSDRENWEQDPDVLDTWFSSWLWPMGTLHYQENSDKNLFDRYFPSHVLVSGSDILFFWITRMILASLELVEDRPLQQRVPFHNIYLTGIVRDAKGRKMSKSLGNSPDPLDLIQTYGADGVRVGMLSIAPQGHDICFDEHALVAGRNFCTKLWNACRFRQMQGRVGNYSSFEDYWKEIASTSLSPIDQYLLHSLVLTMGTYEKRLSQYELNAAIKELQAFFRNFFCDFYLEIQKYQPSSSFVVQDLFLRQMLIMLHPYAPYITEELWEQMHAGSGTLQEAQWELPKLSSHVQALALSSKDLEVMEHIRTLVDQLRTLTAKHSRTPLTVHILLESKHQAEFKAYQALLEQLIKISSFQIVSQPLPGASQVVTHYGTFFVQHEITQPAMDDTQLMQQIAALKQYIQTAEQKLSNEKFMSHASAKVIEGVQKQLEANRKKWEALQKLLP